MDSPPNEREHDPNYRCGRWLASPAAGEEVVISGMSGRLPESNTVHEFRDHLFNKREMVSGDDRRWKVDHPEIPQRTAKIPNIDRYDAGFFGVHHRQANYMDPMMRIFMETAVEAVMDAGINPSELAGSKTGVFVSTSWSDVENDTFVSITRPQRFAVTGYIRSLIAHRVSYYLKLKGPATIIDTACSSSMNALDTAFRAIRNGQCENALVGGTHLLLHPGNSLQFFRLGVLSTDGVCRVFDQNASGYVRGESIACVFLQKAKNSRRIYAQIINTKINADGFKEQGITFPSFLAQKQLMVDIYSESNVHPSELSFLEAHGTGTLVGDPEEVEAIHSALTKNRQEPLLVGSVKSSIGHPEPCSGMCSIIKVLIAMSTGFIAPNINLTQVKKGMTGFEKGKLKALTELTRLEKDDAVIGINNFGFGGNNGHAIMRRFKKRKADTNLGQDGIPRLVCVSGRTEHAVQNLLNDINKISFDPEYIALLHHTYKMDIENHLYRGYTILTKNGPLQTSIKYSAFGQSELYVLFGQFTKNYKVLASHLLNFPIFRSTVSRMNKVLISKNILRFEDLFQQYEHSQKVLASICVQMGVADVLKQIEIHPRAVYGDSCGKLVSAYYYDVISLEETVSTAIKISHLEFDKDVHFQSEFNNFDKLQNHDQFHDGVQSQNLLRRSDEKVRILNISDWSFTDRDLLPVEGNTVKFLDNLGSLYEEGHVPQLHKIYPKVEFPVSRETEMISPSIQWDHRKSWYTYKFKTFATSDAEQHEYKISFLYEEFKFIAGHVIDGRNLFPATEYLNLVWQTLAQSRRLLPKDVPVIFADCKFIRAVTMPASGFVKILVAIQRGSGFFEVLEKDSLVVCGVITPCADISKDMIHEQEPLAFDEMHRSEILEQDEIYRELYLRGYNYSGLFKGIEKCNVEASAGLIKWEDNWTSFMDKMLQIKILQADTRLLYVPVGIKKLLIDPMKHMAMAEKFKKEESLFPVQVYKECNVIRSGGIEISGLQAKSIAKKKLRLEPVLEKYEFVPNACSLTLPEAIRVNIQIILENHNDNSFKSVEIMDDSVHTDSEFLMHLVCKALDDTPVITPDLTISSKEVVNEIPGVKCEDVTLTPESNILLLVGTKILQCSNNLKQILPSLNKDGFVLTREEIDFEPSQLSEDIEIVTNFTTSAERLILCKINRHRFADSKIMKVTSSSFGWLSQLKNLLKQEASVTVYCRNEESSGILGFVKCIRREPNGSKIRCFFMMDEAPEFDATNEFYHKQMNKNLAVNIFKNNSWGTYRHLLLEENPQIDCGYCYVNVTSRGDITSLKWLEGSLTEETPLEEDRLLAAIYYSAVNFKDIMAASGRVNVEALENHRIDQECLIGFEFSGRDSKGRRVTGMSERQAFASHVIADTGFIWEIPDSWTLEDAATVPVVYSTVIYALLMVEDLRIGSSILIHSGTGGIGLAALNVCLHYKCDIYVTVGTEEKREYLRKYYPQIPESHIGNSRDTSFEDVVKTGTNNRGVDVVLNSLSDDKLKASVRCLAQGGRFMEIGKFDLANDTSFNLLLMEMEASYHGIMLDKIFKDSSYLKSRLVKAMYDGIRMGFVKPLPRSVFNRDEVENSYRYMMTGKHMGKVLVKVRDEEKEKVLVPGRRQFKANPRFNCDIRLSYVIIGGLGGVGMELSDWLILRGAKKLLLVSRFGIQSGYQLQRIRIWESYGVKVQISTKDITEKQGCVDLMQEANQLGPVDAVFNLAVVLRDALFEDQTEENFVDSLAPKANATKYLDEVTRKLCPELRYFVVFSSVSCGRGNVGQSNYGMANAIMEEICEKRKREGLPALAIQWGAIGDVGLVAKMQKENKELVIGGTLQQKISNCLEVLDRFLKQNHPIVASMVVAEKYSSDAHTSPVEAIAFILGIKDMKTVSQHATLAELGMDSMMGTEVINVLEKDFDIYVTAKDVRSLTFAKLGELEIEKTTSAEAKDTAKTEQGIHMFVQLIPDSSTSLLPIIKLDSLASSGEERSIVFVLPGIEGVFKPLEPLTKQLKAHVFGVQYNYEKPEITIREVAENTAVYVENQLLKNRSFLLIGYSFGAVLALEAASILESKGHIGKLVLIDGSPTYLSASAKAHFPEEGETEFQTNLILKLMSVLLPLDTPPQYKDKFLKCATLSDRIDLGLALIPAEISNKQELGKQAALSLYNRFKAVKDYDFVDGKISSSVHLFKARYGMVKADEDYNLSKLCEKGVVVNTVDGDHVSILNQPELAEGINKILKD